MPGVQADLRAFLLDAGASEGEIERAANEGWLPLLTLDRLVLPGRATHDLADVAEITGVDEERLTRLWRAVGFPDVPAGLAVFSDADIEAARRLFHGRLARDSDFATLLRQVRVMSVSMARIASVLADHFGDIVRDLRAQRVDDDAIATTLLNTYDGEELSALILYEARLQLRAQIWLRLGRDASPDLAIAIGFADLAGYTALSAELGPERLGELVGRWEEIVYDTVARHGGRVVKTIGDEVMFAGVASQIARTAIALRDAARAEGLPAVHAGIAAGMVVVREGDFYGPVVNLASRLAAVAPPGEIYASAALHGELGDDPSFDWTVVGPLDLRSIGPVEVFALAAPDQRG